MSSQIRLRLGTRVKRLRSSPSIPSGSLGTVCREVNEHDTYIAVRYDCYEYANGRRHHGTDIHLLALVEPLRMDTEVSDEV